MAAGWGSRHARRIGDPRARGSDWHGDLRALPVSDARALSAYSEGLWGGRTRICRRIIPVAVLEIASRRNYISHRVVTGGDVARGSIEIEVGITEELALEFDFALETRLRTLEPLRIAIIELICERLSDVAPAAPKQPVLEIGNWLPLLYMGPAGGRRNGSQSIAPADPAICCTGHTGRCPRASMKPSFSL